MYQLTVVEILPTVINPSDLLSSSLYYDILEPIEWKTPAYLKAHKKFHTCVMNETYGMDIMALWP